MTTSTTRRWHVAATCATHTNPEWWTGSNPADRRKAAQVCRTCPVIRECAAEAEGMTFGVWAGEVRG